MKHLISAGCRKAPTARHLWPFTKAATVIFLTVTLRNQYPSEMQTLSTRSLTARGPPPIQCKACLLSEPTAIRRVSSVSKGEFYMQPYGTFLPWKTTVLKVLQNIVPQQCLRLLCTNVCMPVLLQCNRGGGLTVWTKVQKSPATSSAPAQCCLATRILSSLLFAP